MEDFYINITSRDKNYNYSNISFSSDDFTSITGYSDDQSSIVTLKLLKHVVEWIIICSGLPLTLVAIAAVYSLVRRHHIAPVFIINLLLSDLVQLCCLTAWKAGKPNDFIESFYDFGLIASVGFMVCISLERYLLITQPLWYRFRRNIKTSVGVCIVVWILPLAYVLPEYFDVDFELIETIFAVFLLLPFPLFLFFLVGTIRALSAARSVPADEKRRIVAVLVVVLLIYALLFLPSIIWSLVEEARNNLMFHNISFILVKISPLADLTLYVFIRKGTTDKLLASLCCCQMSTNQQTSSMSNMSASCRQNV